MIGPRLARLVLALVNSGLVVVAGIAGAQTSELPPGPLAADDAVRLALQRNHSVAIAEANYQAARGQSRQALRGVLPSIRSSAVYDHSDVTGPAIVNFRLVTGRTKADSRNFDVVLDQSVFSWANIQSLRSARAGARSSFGLARTEALDVALEVRTQYYTLLQALKQREVRGEAVKLSEDQLKRAETLFELGSVARSDVLQARVNLQSARLEQIQTANQVEIERGQLAQLMGFHADTPIEIQDEIVAEEPVVAEVDSTVLVREALAARPDVEAARESVRSAEASLGAARGGRYPALFGRMNWFWTYLPGEDVDPFGGGGTVENDTQGWIATAGVNIPVFDGMFTEGQVKSAKSRLVSDRSRQAQLELAVALEVKQAILGTREANQSIATAREGVSLAEENLNLAQERYDIGSGTILELDEAQVSLIEARSALVDSQVSLRVAQARLARARGAGLP
jgi:outer membrane protein TolC